MTRSPREIEEARARNGFLLINAVRFSGIALVLIGFAIVRGVIDLPREAGALIAVLGFIAFFFLPRFVARAWNRGAGPNA